tara:strand:- start:600 stop:743 length:144 start_codon:yes stop_codon:yes gene_type:complete
MFYYLYCVTKTGVLAVDAILTGKFYVVSKIRHMRRCDKVRHIKKYEI